MINHKPAGSTILIVEDFDDTRFMLSTMLQMRGCHVLEAVNGQEAVEIAPREHPKLILMDLSLPVLDGISATKQILADAATSNIPIVALSAHCQESDWCKRALDAGCQECVKKPIDFDMLEQILQRFAPN